MICYLFTTQPKNKNTTANIMFIILIRKFFILARCVHRRYMMSQYTGMLLPKILQICIINFKED